jgi:hypothetical protein
MSCIYSQPSNYEPVKNTQKQKEDDSEMINEKNLRFASFKVITSQTAWSDSPFLMDVDKHVYVSHKPSIPLVHQCLYRKLEQKLMNPESDVKVRRRTEHHLRLSVFGIKSEVIESHSYWEYLIFSIHLYKIESDKKWDNLIELAEKSSTEAYQYYNYNDPNNEIPIDKSKYELSVQIAGKFRSGGMSTEIDSYEDMMTKGFSDTLHNYVEEITEELKSCMENSVEQTFDANTGKPIWRF